MLYHKPTQADLQRTAAVAAIVASFAMVAVPTVAPGYKYLKSLIVSAETPSPTP